MDKQIEDILKFFYEVGHLKHVDRSGWKRIGIPQAESVAEHSFRCAIIGYVLARMEGADPDKTAIMCLFHDVSEARIGDVDWTAKRYFPAEMVKLGEKMAMEEQAALLPEDIAAKVLALQTEYEARTPLEGRLAREADLLECILQAREYQLQGYNAAQGWITGSMEHLQTKTGKALAEACLTMEPSAWFDGLKQKPLS